MTQDKSTLAVVILTKDEEVNLPFALRSIQGFVDEIVILDSFSGDRTVEIAESFGAKIFYNEFVDFASQRRHALQAIPVSSDWIFVLDADESLTTDLKNEISSILPTTRYDAFFIKRRFYWQGRWIKWGYYPTWLLRLGRNGLLTCDYRTVNEHLVCNSGRIGYLKNDFIDFNRKSLSAWVAKHNDYSSREAFELFSGDQQLVECRFWGSQNERKRWTRVYIWNRLPPILRPFLFFFYRYFLRFGFLDGVAGLSYHFLHAFVYRILIDLKYFELKKRATLKNKSLLSSKTGSEWEDGNR